MSSENDMSAPIDGPFRSVTTCITAYLTKPIKNQYEKYKFLSNKSYEEYIDYLKKGIYNIRGLEKDPIKQQIDEKCQIAFYNKIYNKTITKILVTASRRTDSALTSGVAPD